jgi:hypothetical protein
MRQPSENAATEETATAGADEDKNEVCQLYGGFNK